MSQARAPGARADAAGLQKSVTMSGGTMKYYTGCLAFCLILWLHCSVKVPELNVTGEKTALENQIFGAYQQIENETWVIASTRSSGRASAPEISAEKQEVLQAVQNRKFNKDDIDELKRSKTTGESNKGFLEILPNDRYQQDAEFRKYADQILAEENHDRRVVFERVTTINQLAAEAGAEKVSEIFAKLNFDNSEPGTMIQNPDGKWIEKAKPGK
jgi:uncharacterized protein YdbL (DUF1318 family)